jgi:tetratricopeptide (TPR) repeat protein
MGVTVASRLERLVRFVPGVAGYQDRENARATDKQVRMRLVEELRRLMRALEQDKERLAESGDLSSLPRLDRLSGRLERASRGVEFAGRGYAGLFDLHKVDGDTLDQLYAFDLGLFDLLSALRARTEALRGALADAAALRTAAEHMAEALDDFEELFDKRRRIVEPD